MSDAGFARLEEVFARARRLPPAERARFLDEACGGAPSLRAEVEALLAAAESPGDPFAAPALGDTLGPASGAWPPERVGAYRITRVLGAGGMGVVFEAEQEHPRRRVALKLVRPELATAALRRRFASEAEALGRLAHPGIAQIHEAGVAGGVPFLAMERVEGRPLLRFATEEQLARPAILLLFAAICDAVEHAHRRGVVHRDLKPSNVLVEGGREAPRPRVLDFGVARLLGAASEPATLATRPGEVVGTLAYMSPEQASGTRDAVGPATDVYALGAILFELLTGRVPHEVAGRELPEAIRALCEDDPPPPSAIDPTLAGDLEVILGKALERDPRRRYRSAAALAEDVRRHLRDDPILARPPSARYRVAKFVRRHRAFVASAAGVVGALLVGLAATVWQWRAAAGARDAERAQRRVAERIFEDVRGLARAFVFDISDALRDVPGALDARRLLAATAVEYLDRLAAEDPAETGLLRELAAAYAKIGDVQGAPHLSNLGDLHGALASYDKALAQLDQLDRLVPDLASTWLGDRIVLLLRRGDVLGGMGHAGEMLASYEAARGAVAAVAGDSSSEVALREQVESRIGGALMSAGRTQDALVHFEAQRARDAARAARSPDATAVQRDLAVSTFKVGTALQALDRLEEACATFRSSLAATEELAAREPESVLLQRDLAVAHSRLGEIEHLRGETDAACRHLRRAIAAAEGLAAADPGDLQIRLDLCGYWNRLGETRLAAADPDLAEPEFARFLALAEEVARRVPAHPVARRHHAVALYKMGELARARAAGATGVERAARLSEARDWLERCRAAFAALGAEGLLAASDAGVAEELAREIAACGAAQQPDGTE